MDASPDGPTTHTDLFDVVDGGLACRVCGALVPRTGSYAQAHWDWHEAANGA